jgi:hypothetical protein
MMTKPKGRPLKNIRIKMAQNEKQIFALAAIAIISITLALFILIQDIKTSKMTGRATGIGEGNVYGVIFIMTILLIASITAIIWLKKNKRLNNIFPFQKISGGKKQ